MRLENRTGEGERYQVNRGVVAVHDEAARRVESLSLGGKEVVDHQTYTLCLQGYHARTSAQYINLSCEELVEQGKPKVVRPASRTYWRST